MTDLKPITKELADILQHMRKVIDERPGDSVYFGTPTLVKIDAALERYEEDFKLSEKPKMKFDLKDFLNKKVMVKLFDGRILTGVILRRPDEGLFRFQYSILESKSDDSYSEMERKYTSDGIYISGGKYEPSPHINNIVDIQFTEYLINTKCQYNDCGWCYAPSHLNNNAVNGACKNPNECPTLNDKEFMTTEPEFTIEPEVIDDLWQTTANYKTFAMNIAKMMSSSTKVKVSNQWAKALSGLIDKLGGDSPALWEWSDKTPTPEKVVECLQELVDFHMSIAADNELEECCEWVSKHRPYFGDFPTPENKLRTARRPQPTLKSQALKNFESVRKHSDLLPEILDTIENALKSIPE